MTVTPHQQRTLLIWWLDGIAGRMATGPGEYNRTSITKPLTIHLLMQICSVNLKRVKITIQNQVVNY